MLRTINESKFPFTEILSIEASTKQSEDLASSQSLKLCRPTYSISTRVESYSLNRRRTSLKAVPVARYSVVESRILPQNSPIAPLQSLQKGWDGYWAEPLSQEVLLRAHQLWRQIERIAKTEAEYPTIRPSANGSVAFTWSAEYPEKELEIWLFDQIDYYAEWMLNVGDVDEEGTTQSQAELLRIIKRFQEL